MCLRTPLRINSAKLDCSLCHKRQTKAVADNKRFEQVTRNFESSTQRNVKTVVCASSHGLTHALKMTNVSGMLRVQMRGFLAKPLYSKECFTAIVLLKNYFGIDITSSV